MIQINSQNLLSDGYVKKNKTKEAIVFNLNETTNKTARFNVEHNIFVTIRLDLDSELTWTKRTLLSELREPFLRKTFEAPAKEITHASS